MVIFLDSNCSIRCSLQLYAITQQSVTTLSYSTQNMYISALISKLPICLTARRPPEGLIFIVAAMGDIQFNFFSSCFSSYRCVLLLLLLLLLLFSYFEMWYRAVYWINYYYYSYYYYYKRHRHNNNNISCTSVVSIVVKVRTRESRQKQEMFLFSKV